MGGATIADTLLPCAECARALGIPAEAGVKITYLG